MHFTLTVLRQKKRDKRLVQSACQGKNDTVRKTKKIHYARTHTTTVTLLITTVKNGFEQIKKGSKNKTGLLDILNNILYNYIENYKSVRNV